MIDRVGSELSGISMTEKEKPTEEPKSSDPRLTRTEFLKQIIVAGSLAATPVILDKFLVQPAPAQSVRGTPLGRPAIPGVMQ